jgi:hypothetical protein
VSFDNFVRSVEKRYPEFIVRKRDEEISLINLNERGNKINLFLLFRKVVSPFAFLHVVSVEKEGYEVPKNVLKLQKNSSLSRWSELDAMLEVLVKHEPADIDYLAHVKKELNKIVDMLETPNFQLIQAQLDMILTSKNNLRYSKHVLVFAAELLCVSPAAYRMIRRCGVIKLPREQIVRDLMTRSLDDQNLTALLRDLQPQRRLVTLIFDDVKLRSALRFTAGHIMGHALNVPDQLSTTVYICSMF